MEQDNTISALNDKIRKLNTDIESWKLKYQLIVEKSNNEHES